MARRPKKRKPVQKQQLHSTPKKLERQLALIETNMENGRLAYARELLDRLLARYPKHPDALRTAVDLCAEQHDWANLITYGERLIPIADTAEKPTIQQNIAASYFYQGYVVLALREARRIPQQWPDFYRRTKIAREMLESLEEGYKEIVVKSLLPDNLFATDEETFGFALLQDQARFFVEQGDYEAGQKVNHQLLTIYPDFIPALNNLSLCHFQLSELDKAIAMSQKVLAQEPHNFHGLGNIARYHFIQGNEAEAKRVAAQLETLHNENADLWHKQAEIFAFLGNDAAILDVLARAQKSKYKQHIPAFLYFTAGVANMRLGHQKTAEKLWRRAVKSELLHLAQENLDELSLPVGERHTPWYYTLQYWLPPDLQRSLQGLSNNKRGEKQLAKLVQKYSYLETLAPHILDRGDEGARNFVFHWAKITESESVLQALYTFALGPRGSDSFRSSIWHYLRDTYPDRFPETEVDMWVQGKQTQVRLYKYEIYDEPNEVNYGAANEQFLAAVDAMQSNDYRKAVTLLQEAIAMEPQFPAFYNNLAAVYGRLGEPEKADKLVEQIYKDFPDYFFGRTGLARKRAEEGQVKEASDLIAPLITMERYHISEYAALTQTQMTIALAQNEISRAEGLLETLEDMEILDDRALDYWQKRLQIAHLSSEKSIFKWLARFGQ